eukprot:Sspe_Gene.74662::Locus_46649_Transcript_1_1_Confidence_1.000_Length_1655::g.74662::m.74662
MPPPYGVPAILPVLLLLAAGAHGRFYKQYAYVTPFPDVDCGSITFSGCNCNTPIQGSMVDIEDGFDSSRDTLDCPACASLGLTTRFDKATGLLHILGKASIATHAKAIKSVRFRTTSGDGKPRRVTYNYGHAMYSTATGHFYEFFNRGDGKICKSGKTCRWDDAQAECADRGNDLLGLVGYLVTVTQQSEQNVVSSKLKGRGWLGATDAGREGQWRWVTGPEGGCARTNLQGARRSACDLGYPVRKTSNPCNGGECNRGQLVSFSRWASGEPNDWRRCTWRWFRRRCTGEGEDFGHFYESGTWNDYIVDNSGVQGYVCEWGGVGQLCMDDDDVYGTLVLVAGCGSYKNQGSCEAHLPQGSCRWDPVTLTCVEDGCHALETEASCALDKACKWDTSKNPDECVDEYCPARHKSQSACDADKSSNGPCRWDGKECMPLHCHDITDRCECVKRADHCVWDTKNDHCVDPKFTECPPADMIFLLDGSGSMNTRFGSHSNGYYGMMEEMRR